MGADLYGQARVGDLSPWFSYSFVDYDEETNGGETGLRGISAHNGRLGATWILTPELIVTPSAVIRSKPRNVAPGSLDSELDTPWEINLHVMYKAAQNLELFATIRNLTDNTYALGSFTADAVPQETLRAVVGIRGQL
jgi:hypothetical protein